MVLWDYTYEHTFVRLLVVVIRFAFWCIIQTFKDIYNDIRTNEESNSMPETRFLANQQNMWRGPCEPKLTWQTKKSTLAVFCRFYQFTLISTWVVALFERFIEVKTYTYHHIFFRLYRFKCVICLMVQQYLFPFETNSTENIMILSPMEISSVFANIKWLEFHSRVLFCVWLRETEEKFKEMIFSKAHTQQH